MVSKTFPTTSGQIYDEIKTGFPDNGWSKPAVFRGDIYWTVGRHGIDFSKCSPVVSPTAELMLLHYRGLGVDYVRWRHARNWERVPERCRSQSFGVNTSPGHDDHHGLDWFIEQIGKDWPNVIQ
jgi:hypothetical protein